MRLSLWFVNPHKPELFRFALAGVGKATRFAERGKLASAAATFQWTSAVRAFAQLALGTRYARTATGQASYELSGQKGSPAASLDFALSKPAAWVRDAFCHSSQRRADIRRIFRISNSEQKRAGPVIVSLTSAIDSIKIFVDGRELVKRDELAALLEALGGDSHSSEELASSSSEFSADFEHDAEQALQETDLLEGMAIRLARARLNKLPWAKHNRQVQNTLRQLQESVPASALRYRKASGLPPQEKFEVRCPAMAVGLLVLLRYVTRAFKVSIQIEYSFPSTSSMLETAKADAAGLVLSWGALSKAAFLKRSHRAAMLLPRTAIDVITDCQVPHERVCLATEARGYPMQYLNALRRNPRFRKLRAINANFSEIHTALRQGQRSALLSFPFSVFLARRYGMEIFSPYNVESRIGDNVLFVPVKNSPCVAAWQALMPFLREGWWQLLADRGLIAAEIGELLSDRDYTHYLDRCAGIAAWAR